MKTHCPLWGGYRRDPEQVIWSEDSVPENEAWGLTKMCFVTREIHIYQQDNSVAVTATSTTSSCERGFYEVKLA